ncbi:uncharacterized protein J3D65DRAFT_639357 [Phyllosticta citribraziliensis]|uniref:Uncharacterized protein n=1 Tax=Phyllosticta citribraziliensis TaxID=989973 RepID=A0ABR1LA80_9PEZI
MGECTSDDKSLCYVPAPSTRHELGILFGFLGLMIVCMSVYAVAWNVGNRRSLQKEADRVAALRASGHLDEIEKSRLGTGEGA